MEVGFQAESPFREVLAPVRDEVAKFPLGAAAWTSVGIVLLDIDEWSQVLSALAAY